MRIAPLFAALLCTSAAFAVELRYPQATLRGFPDLSDEKGHKIADGRLVQWVEGERLHARLVWSFPDGRTVTEEAELQQGKELSQTRWSFEDKSAGTVQRHFEVDFAGKRASGFKLEKGGKRSHWDEKIDVTPGKTFAGVGASFAAANLIDRLKKGEELDIDVVGWLPKPRVTGVRLKLGGTQTLRRGGKSLPVDMIVLHPKVPWPINKIVGAKDIHLFYFHDDPPQLMRAEEPMAEVKDPVVRIDVLPGGEKLPLPQARSGR